MRLQHATGGGECLHSEPGGVDELIALSKSQDWSWVTRPLGDGKNPAVESFAVASPFLQ